MADIAEPIIALIPKQSRQMHIKLAEAAGQSGWIVSVGAGLMP